MTPSTQDLTTKSEQLVARRATLQARADAIQSRLAALTDERDGHVIAGRDAAAAELAPAVRQLSEDHNTLAEALARLSAEILSADERERQARRDAERAEAEAGFEAARQSFRDAQDAAIATLRQFAVFFLPPRLAAVRAAHAAGEAARTRLNVASGVVEAWDGNLWDFKHLKDSEMLREIEVYGRQVGPTISRTDAGPSQTELQARARAAVGET